jgi:hypothetical protein
MYQILIFGRQALDIPGLLLPEKFPHDSLMDRVSGDPRRIGINFRVFRIVILGFLE